MKHVAEKRATIATGDLMIVPSSNLDLPPAELTHVAYVTDAFDQAVAMLRRRHQLPEFRDLGPFTRSFEPGGLTSLRVGFAGAGPIQIEVIQPLSGFIDHYHLAPEGRPGSVRFHHLGYRVSSLADLDRFRHDLDANDFPVVMGGKPGEPMHFLYADTRAALGHYLEYVVADPSVA